jgi:rhodanese-related sulfurtransferase
MKKKIAFLNLCAIVLLLLSCTSVPNGKSFETITVAKLYTLLASKITVLDVRTPEEVALGAIEKSINIDFYRPSFKQDLDKLDKKTPIVVYCKIGGRSSKAAQILVDQGFGKVYNLDGGYTAWEKQTAK